MNNEKLIEVLLELIKKPETNLEKNGIIKIAVLQRGWVCIGRYYENGDQCMLRDAYVIRRWGTTEGLGQLANEGKQEETKLEKTGIVEWHRLTGIMTIDCNFDKWNSILK